VEAKAPKTEVKGTRRMGYLSNCLQMLISTIYTIFECYAKDQLHEWPEPPDPLW